MEVWQLSLIQNSIIFVGVFIIIWLQYYSILKSKNIFLEFYKQSFAILSWIIIWILLHFLIVKNLYNEIYIVMYCIIPIIFIWIFFFTKNILNETSIELISDTIISSIKWILYTLILVFLIQIILVNFL